MDGSLELRTDRSTSSQSRRPSQGPDSFPGGGRRRRRTKSTGDSSTSTSRPFRETHSTCCGTTRSFRGRSTPAAQLLPSRLGCSPTRRDRRPPDVESRRWRRSCEPPDQGPFGIFAARLRIENFPTPDDAPAGLRQAFETIVLTGRAIARSCGKRRTWSWHVH